MRDRLTYRYPRTLLEAFGCDANTAVAVHGPYKKPSDSTVVLSVIAALVLARARV